MEEILASIRRIIADDDTSYRSNESAPAPAASESVLPPAARAAAPAPREAAAPSREPAKEDIDAMLAQLRGPSRYAPAAHEPALGSGAEQTADPDASAFAAGDERSDDAFAARPPAPPAGHPATERRTAADGGDPALMSAATGAAVGSAFNRLAQAVVVEKSRTLEELVSEMLQPMLKAWLDDNLPGLVDRLVQAEIERISRAKG